MNSLFFNKKILKVQTISDSFQLLTFFSQFTLHITHYAVNFHSIFQTCWNYPVVCRVCNNSTCVIVPHGHASHRIRRYPLVFSPAARLHPLLEKAPTDSVMNTNNANEHELWAVEQPPVRSFAFQFKTKNGELKTTPEARDKLVKST